MSKNSFPKKKGRWSCCNYCCSGQISYRQRIAFYFCIFLYYIVQLSLYPKYVESDGDNTDEGIHKLILFLEIVLFLLSLLILLSAWAFRPMFEKYALLWNVFLLSFSLVWLIVNVPIHSMNSPECIINFLIVMCILYIDMSVQVHSSPQAYMYPWIIARKQAKLQRNKQKQSTESNEGRKSLFSVSMWNTKKSKSSSEKQKQANKKRRKQKQRRYQQDYELTASTSSSSGLLDYIVFITLSCIYNYHCIIQAEGEQARRRKKLMHTSSLRTRTRCRCLWPRLRSTTTTMQTAI